MNRNDIALLKTLIAQGGGILEFLKDREQELVDNWRSVCTLKQSEQCLSPDEIRSSLVRGIKDLSLDDCYLSPADQTLKCNVDTHTVEFSLTILPDSIYVQEIHCKELPMNSGAKIMANIIGLAAKLGKERVESAAAMVGGYAWPKMGFQQQGNNLPERRFIDERLQRVMEQHEKILLEELNKNCSNDPEKSAEHHKLYESLMRESALTRQYVIDLMEKFGSHPRVFKKIAATDTPIYIDQNNQENAGKAIMLGQYLDHIHFPLGDDPQSLRALKDLNQYLRRKKIDPIDIG